MKHLGINKLKKITLLLNVSLLLVASLSANSKAFLEGEKIYEETCVSCHGIDGETNPKMKLVVKPRKLNQTILTQEQSFEVIKEGAHHWGAHSDIMPAFKYVYSDDKIKSVATYITQKYNLNREKRVKKLLDESDKISKDQEAKMMKTGAKIFKRNCSLCHGITGNGESVYVEQSNANNTFIYPYNLQKTLLNEDQIFLYAKFGGHYWGTEKTDMPSWKKKYNDFKLKSVAKYINEKIKNHDHKNH